MEKSGDRKFSLEDPFGLLTSGDCIRGNGRSKSYLRHSIPPTSLFLSFLFTVSSFPAALVFSSTLNLFSSYLIWSFPLFFLPFSYIYLSYLLWHAFLISNVLSFVHPHVSSFFFFFFIKILNVTYRSYVCSTQCAN